MIATYTLKPGQPLTPEQIAMLEALKNRPIVYDEDCPESTPEVLEAFHRAAIERNRRLAREGKKPPREDG